MNLVETVPILMNTKGRLLDREEVIRFLPDECRRSKAIREMLNSSAVYPAEFLWFIYRNPDAIPPLLEGAVARVMMLDKTGWHRGTVRLELVFYPDKETADTNVCGEIRDANNETNNVSDETSPSESSSQS
ncbi:hypothetical protein [uncultured Thermosynechococcus sp.]|uniref:hypothetical protein n=1 Tax=uncultured Thermosynechococcus sp. TaxID=436945 RepID=UPI0026268272|nr:hypothetical protein [uncultured Thermosynechococcus sp.]